MSTNVLESENGRASSIPSNILPWQYMGESHGVISEPLTYSADAVVAKAAKATDKCLREAIVQRAIRLKGQCFTARERVTPTRETDETRV